MKWALSAYLRTPLIVHFKFKQHELGLTESRVEAGVGFNFFRAQRLGFRV